MLNDDKSSIVLLVQNSRNVFCYFNISPISIKEFQDRYGENEWRNSKPVLKVYKVSNGIASEVKMIYIDAFADNWYIHMDKDDMDLFVKIGRALTDDTFICLAVSNTVTTPRESQSSDSAVYYVDVSEDFLAPNSELPKCDENLNKQNIHKEPKPYPFGEVKKKLENIQI